MDPEKVKAALEAIKNGDTDAALAILEEMIIMAAGGGEAPASEEPVEPLADNAEPPPEDEEKLMAAALKKLTGRESAGEAIAALTALAKRVDALDAEHAKLDLSARRELIAELVKLGVEFPSTAWQGKPEDRVPVKRLADEPLEGLRARVALHRQAPRPVAATPTSSNTELGGKEIQTSHGLVTLSAREIKNCEELGAKVETYAENKAIHEAAKRGRSQQ